MPRSIDHIPDLKGLARRLRQRREEVGLSQRQLAFPGCTAAYISRIEAGARTPSRQMVDKLAELLGTTREWLETGNGAAAHIHIAINAGELEKEMARWFGESTEPEDVVTWENLDAEERAMVIRAMETAALAKVGGMATAISVNRRLKREAIAQLDDDLSARLHAAGAADPEGAHTA